LTQLKSVSKGMTNKQRDNIETGFISCDSQKLD